MAPGPAAPIDLFTRQAALYARYRPTYPQQLLECVASHCREPRQLAWDVGTGSGQAAVELAKYFSRVVATDVSEGQLAHARQHPNVTYAATSDRPTVDQLSTIVGAPGSVDLITVAQAYHWFDFQHFASIAGKMLRPGGVVAVWGYGYGRVDAKVDRVLDDFYHSTLPYWEPQRQYIDEGYSTIPFHFAPLPGKDSTGPFPFEIELRMSVSDVLGYFSSWSAVQTAKQKDVELVNDDLRARLIAVWGADADVQRTVRVPVFLLLGAPDTS